jgi:hypothetical protein
MYALSACAGHGDCSHTLEMVPRAASLLLAASLQLGWTRDRIVLLVENHSSNQSAAAEITPALADQLASKGFDVVPPGEVTPALGAAGVKDAGDITPAVAEQLSTALKAEAVLTVTVSFFLDSRARPRGPKASPAFGMIAKMYASSGKPQWSASLGWIADDVAAPAGFGFKRGPPKPTALACERLLWSLPRGRPDPAGQRQVAVALEGAKPPTSTRWAAPLWRRRESAGIARFPLRLR